ncbi:MAG TPA: PKD domain-containing protein [Longimicrobium sp.]|nr:PKD domain-containing protein [Longimicrobium sp.]
MRRIRAFHAACVLATSVLAACTDQLTESLTEEPLEPAAPTSAVRCTVSVRAGSVSCAEGPKASRISAARLPARPRGSGAVPYPTVRIIGGQGVNVRLQSTNVQFDPATRILSADVTVQNLIENSQLGSADGKTLSGIRVFFNSGPTPTVGSGKVEVLDHDGDDAFTQSTQPFYTYGQALTHEATTKARRWAFRLDPTVQTFEFTVFVEAPLFRDGEIPPVFGTWSWIDAGPGHTCGLVGTDAFCWGDGYFGKLGDGILRDRFFVEPDPVIGGLQWREIAANDYHSCGVTVDYQAYCWGDNTFGQVGTGPEYERGGFYPKRQNMQPARVGGDVAFAHVSLGGAYTCGVSVEGKAYCWGKNDFGQLGNGTFTPSQNPVEVLTDVRFVKIQAGSAAVCALTQNGQVWCWGYNGRGELGTETSSHTCGTFTEPCSPVPVRVQTDQVFKDLSKKLNWACALNTEGKAYCWGNAASNVLGNNAETDPLYIATPGPVQTPQPQTFTSIHTGGNGSCGVRADGVAFCWGLGHRLFVDPDTWQAPGDVRWKMLAMGGNRVCGIDLAGKGWCWGSESRGEIGDGEPQHGFYTSPVPIGPLHLRDLPPYAGFDVAIGGREVTARATGTINWWRDTPSITHDDYDIVHYIWSWGDGTTTAGPFYSYASHAYAKNGTYQVTLTVIDNVGQRGIRTTWVSPYHYEP